MHFNQTLRPGKLIKRYKRFLADIELENGEIITAHCPNSGSMKSCAYPGWSVRLSLSSNPKRKYPYTWEMVYNGKCWIGINTSIPIIVSREAILKNHINELTGYSSIREEVKYSKNSRIDLLLENEGELCYVEIKNVTLVEEDGRYYFPDAITERGRKHLYELRDMVQEGHRAVMLYIIQRRDGSVFRPASHIDSIYAKSLKEVYDQGVEILVYRAEVCPEFVEVRESVPWQLV
jgi:sugar fermentation stimulation protein A